jgi:hypothetical protein
MPSILHTGIQPITYREQKCPIQVVKKKPFKIIKNPKGGKVF